MLALQSLLLALLPAPVLLLLLLRSRCCPPSASISFPSAAAAAAGTATDTTGTTDATVHATHTTKHRPAECMRMPFPKVHSHAALPCAGAWPPHAKGHATLHAGPCHPPALTMQTSGVTLSCGQQGMQECGRKSRQQQGEGAVAGCRQRFLCCTFPLGCRFHVH